MSILAKIQSLQSRLLPRKPLAADGRLLVLELRASGVLAVLVGAAQVQAPLVKRADFWPCLPSGRAAALNGLAARQGWVAGQRAVLMLGAAQRQLSAVARPPVEPEALREAARWQLVDAVDYPPEEAALDVLTLGTQGPVNRQQLMVFSLHRPALAELLAPVQTTRLRLEAVDVVDCAQRNLVGLLNGGTQPLAALSLRDGQLLFTVSQGSELMISRQFDAPEPQVPGTADSPKRLRDEEALAERVGLQLQRALDTLERRTAQWMPSTLLLLPHDRRGALLELCAELTGLRVVPLDTSMLMGTGPATETAGPDRSEFVHLLGAALRQPAAVAPMPQAA